MDANNGLNSGLHVTDGVWTHGPVQLPRGRSAKDPNAQTASYTVNSLEHFESSLRAYLDDPPPNPEHAEGHFSFWIGAAFLVQPPGLSPQERVALEAQQKRQQQDNRQNTVAPPAYPPSSLDAHYAAVTQAQNPQTLQPQENESHAEGPNGSNSEPLRVSMSVVEALAPTPDPKDRMRKQRAIAKTCIDAVQRVDGYRYSFHNNWNSREDDAFRFSYYCNDSLLNKDRAANGKGQKVAGKRATKPVYDCRGVLAVKFSAVKQSLEVHYKHNPIHKTYEERAPPPRRDSKRRKWLLVNHPDAFPPRKPRREQELDPNAPTPPVKKRKTKKPERDEPANSIESSLRAQSLQSLLELIRVDGPPATSGATTPNVNTTNLVRQAHEATQLTNAKQASNAETPLKRRPRSSCDNCRTKRIGCDNARPACKSCVDKGRECSYNEPGENGVRRSVPTAKHPIQLPNGGLLNGSTNTALSVSPTQNVAAPQTELSEVEKMKAELELAKQRIAQLEAEKTASPTSHSNNATPNLNSINTVNDTPLVREPMHHTQYQNLQTPTHIPARHESFARQHLQTLSQQQQQQQTQAHPIQNTQWSHWQQPYGYQPANIQPPRPDQWVNRNNIYRQ